MSFPSVEEALNNIVDELGMLKCEIEYYGYDPDRISNEKAIGTLCAKVIDLIEIIKGASAPVDTGMTAEDYEAIYGWGGQG
jgi:hypothetical protein